MDNYKTQDINIVISNFSKKINKYEIEYKNQPLILFKSINKLIDLVIDFCIKMNIENIKNIYTSHSEFVSTFKEELVYFLFSKIDIDDDIYNKNMLLFDKNDDSYHKEYEINMNDYGTLGTLGTQETNKTNKTNTSKLIEESEKIGVHIYIMKKQNKFKIFLDKLDSSCHDYISQK